MDPLLRWRPARAAVALGLVSGTFLALVAGYLALVWLFRPVVFLVMAIAAIAAPAAAVALWRGRWSAGGSGAAQRAALAVVAGSLIAGAVLAAVRAAEENRIRDLGVPSEALVAGWLVFFGATLLSLALLVAASPLGLRRALAASVAVAATVAGAGAVALAGAVQSATGCGDDRIDRQSWVAARADERDGAVTDQERIAHAIVDCGLLDGRSRQEVRSILGRPDRAGPKRWVWNAGWVNDGIGPGDGQELIIRFDDERVSRSTLLYPPD